MKPDKQEIESLKTLYSLEGTYYSNRVPIFHIRNKWTIKDRHRSELHRSLSVSFSGHRRKKKDYINWPLLVKFWKQWVRYFDGKGCDMTCDDDGLRIETDSGWAIYREGSPNHNWELVEYEGTMR